MAAGSGSQAPSTSRSATDQSRNRTAPRSPHSVQVLWSSLSVVPTPPVNVTGRPAAVSRAAMARSLAPGTSKRACPASRAIAPHNRRVRNRKCDTTSRVKPPCAGRSSQPAASRCQGRGQLANPTSISSRNCRPTKPLSSHSFRVATAGDDASTKFTATRPTPTASTKSCPSATSTASGFSQNTALFAAIAASAWSRWLAGGEATYTHCAPAISAAADSACGASPPIRANASADGSQMPVTRTRSEACSSAACSMRSPMMPAPIIPMVTMFQPVKSHEKIDAVRVALD